MELLRQITFKAAVFSKKAMKILEALLAARTSPIAKRVSYCFIARRETGELCVEFFDLQSELPNFVHEAGSMLLNIAKSIGAASTMQLRAKAEGEWEWNGERFAAKDISLLGYLLEGRSVKSLKRNFGDEAVDEMVGRPANPLEAVKIRLYRENVAKLFHQKESEMKKISVEYYEKQTAGPIDLVPYMQLRREYQAKADALDAWLRAELGKLKVDYEK